MGKRRIAEIPQEYSTQDLHGLVLEKDPDSHGFFIFLHRTLQESCTFDDWYPTEEEALKQAKQLYGVAPAAWHDQD